jgi:purine nucleosidase
MGNSWIPSSEFNFYVDPEAAAIVFQHWAGLELISWETTLDHGLSPQQVEQLTGIGSPRADFFRRTIQNRYLKQVPGVPP